MDQPDHRADQLASQLEPASFEPLVIEAFRKAGGDPDAAATQLEVF